MKVIDLSKDPLIIDKRQTIDLLDKAFLHLLAERTRVVKKIIYIKQVDKLDLHPGEKREQDKFTLFSLSIRLNLGKEFFQTILDLIFSDAILHLPATVLEQAEIMKAQCSDLRLDDLRQNLLNLDQAILFIFSERFSIVKKIGLHKKKLGIKPLDPKRWDQVLNHKVILAAEIGINATLTKELFQAIHKAALEIEEISD